MRQAHGNGSGRSVAILWILPALFFLSGAAGLSYQIVWTRMLAPGLGHEVAAMVAVVAAFFSGMALGARLVDGAVRRAERPARIFAAAECVAGIWGLASAALVPAANRLAPALLGASPSPAAHAFVAFLLAFVAFLPSTAALGATFPAMERALSLRTAEGRCVGTVYAASTLGGVAGVLAAAFLLVPALGFRGSLAVLAVANLLAALGAWALAGRGEAVIDPSEPPRVPPALPPALPPAPRGLLSALAVTGLLGIGYETLGVRILSQFLENTITTFAAILAVYLAGTTLGAALYQRFGRSRPFGPLLADIAVALATACLLGAALVGESARLHAFARDRLGDGVLAVLLAEVLAAAVVFAVPTTLMGALFAHLVQTARDAGLGVGRAAAANSAGAAVSGVVFIVGLLPFAGARGAFVLLALGYLALLSAARARWPLALIPLALTFLLPARVGIVDVPPGGKLRAHVDGFLASVSVVETADGGRVLRVNNRFQMGGTAAATAEARESLIPLLLHEAVRGGSGGEAGTETSTNGVPTVAPESGASPAAARARRALLLGTGTGITLGAAVADPALEADGVEILPEAIAMMPWFASRSGSPERNPRVRMLAADARRFVRAAPPGYDVVIADVFHPARDGAAGLYAREHFAAIRRILREGGLFCQWLPLHQLDAGTLRVIVRTFLDVFPETSAFLLHFSVDVPVLGLVGSEGALTVPPDALEGRPGRGEVEARSRDAGLPGTIHLLGTFVAGRRALGSFAGGAPANTDDRPIVAALATAHLRRRGIPPYESLFDLLASVRPAAGPELEALVAGGVASGGRDAADRSAPGDGTASGDGTAAGEAGARGAAFRAHLAAYVAARDRYLRGLVEEGTGRLGPAVDAYLDAVRTSLYFTPAYARLVTIVQAMAAGDIAGAREVFRRLEEARPDQPLGRRILGPLLEG